MLDPEARHRTLQLLGVELRKVPRDGDGDGFYDPDGKGPAPDRTPMPPRPKHWRQEMWKRPHKPAATGQIQPWTPPAASVPEPHTMADQVKHWHRPTDLADMDDLLDSAASGGRATRLVDHGPDVRAAAVEFGDGTDGVNTRYLGSGREPEDEADGDQLISAQARAFGISAPRVLRIDDARTVSDLVDGPTWAESDQDLDTPAAQRLGLLDLLAGIDTRDPDSVRLGPDGVVPVQSANGFTDVAAGIDTGKDDKRAERLKRLAAAIDASGPTGLSRADISARMGSGLSAAQRHELLAELLDSGDYVQLPNSRGNKGQGSKFVSLRRQPAPAASTGRDPAEAPADTDGLAFWAPFASDGEWTDNPLTPEDARWLRQQLDELRPQFAHLGRPHWWQFASARLDILTDHASGDENLFAPRPLTERSTSELVALLRARGLPTTGSREELLRRLYAAGITA